MKASKSLIIGISVIAFIVILYYFVYLGDKVEWTEWVADSPEPLCGTGTRTFTRKCTVNSTIQATTDSCKALFVGESDQKIVEYDLGRCSVSGRYIFIERMEHSGVAHTDGNVINLVEVKVFDKNGDSLIRSGTTASVSNQFSETQFPPMALLDGNMNSVASTRPGLDEWFRIDLGSDKDISRVEIYNRPFSIQRLNGVRIRIVDSSNQTVFTGPVINNAGNVHSYDM